jgi:hypothetical protein
MADLHPVPPKGDTTQQKSASGNTGVYSQPEPTDTSESASKKRVGVYDRPESALGSWSPVTIIALVLGVLFLLWMFGIFDYLLG